MCGGSRYIRLTIKPLQEDESYVLIEGDQTAFCFLSDLCGKNTIECVDCGDKLTNRGCGAQIATSDEDAEAFAVQIGLHA